MSKIKRLFNLPHATLLQHAEVVAKNYPGDVDVFAAFDSTFSVEYGARLLTSLDAARAVKSDQVVIDEMAQHTKLVNEAMKDCLDAYKSLAYFVKKAFKDEKHIQDQFGFNDLNKLRGSQPKMIVFMENHAGTAIRYKAELVAAGCSEELIDSLPEKAKALKIAEREQESFKHERASISADRTAKMNALYEPLKALHNAAQIIFEDQDAKKAIYSLPKPQRVTKPKEEEESQESES